MAGEEAWGQEIQGRGRWGEGGKKGPGPRALQWQGLRREGGLGGKEKNAGEWGSGQRVGGGVSSGGSGDSQVRVGRGRGGGEENADEAQPARSMEGWQLEEAS